MIEPYYRSGQAAQLLGISAYHVRRLCETGLIDAVLTASGHWQIPASEIQLLQEKGIPEIPAGIHEGSKELLPTRPDSDRQVDLAPAARPQEVSAAVVESADQVKIARNRLERRKVELEAEDIEDQFGERAKRKVKHEKERVMMEQQRQGQKVALQERRILEGLYLLYAFRRLPEDAPPDVRLRIPALLARTLADLDIYQVPALNLPFVDSVVETAMAPWRRQQAIDRIVEEAVSRLPSAAKEIFGSSVWQVRAAAAAHQFIRELPEGASWEEIRCAARQAVDGVIKEFERRGVPTNPLSTL